MTKTKFFLSTLMNNTSHRFSPHLHDETTDDSNSEYLRESLGIRTRVFQRKLNNPRSIQIRDISNDIHDLVNELWRLYWMTQNAKKINEQFLNVLADLFLYITLFSDPKDMDEDEYYNVILENFKSKITPERLSKLKRKSTKMTEEIKIKTDEIFHKIQKLYSIIIQL